VNSIQNFNIYEQGKNKEMIEIGTLTAAISNVQGELLDSFSRGPKDDEEPYPGEF